MADSSFLIDAQGGVHLIDTLQRSLTALNEVAKSEQFEQFRIDAQDFLSARERGEAPGTRIDEMTVAMDDASEVTNRSFPQVEASGQYTNVISPVVIPKSHRSYFWLVWVVLLGGMGIVGSVSTSLLDNTLGLTNLANALRTALLARAAGIHRLYCMEAELRDGAGWLPGTDHQVR